jgi:hypothetical protein
MAAPFVFRRNVNTFCALPAIWVTQRVNVAC